jgi:hypothetical protein
VLTSFDWLGLLHPVLAVLFIYPVAGTVVRLGILSREHRTGYNPRLPETVRTEHWEHGRWLTSAVVVAVLIALGYTFMAKGVPTAGQGLLLGLAWLGSLLALLALWRVRRPALRAGFALLTWAGLLGLGSQPQVWRLADNPLQPAFWGSHYWAGVLLTGLLLYNLAARPETQRSPQMRRLHLAVNLLVTLLFAVQGITGCRDLLQIPPRGAAAAALQPAGGSSTAA